MANNEGNKNAFWGLAATSAYSVYVADRQTLTQNEK